MAIKYEEHKNGVYAKIDIYYVDGMNIDYLIKALSELKNKGFDKCDLEYENGYYGGIEDACLSFWKPSTIKQ